MAQLDKIRLSGTTYDIIDSTAVHSLDGYYTTGETNAAITAATNALAESIAEQDYASKAYVQSAITEASGVTTGQVQSMIDQSVSGKANSSDVVTNVTASTVNVGGRNNFTLNVTKGGAASNPIVFAIESGFTYNTTSKVIGIDTSVIAQTSDIPAVTGYADTVAYDTNSKEMKFYHGGTGGTEVYSFDASPFLIDGMVQNVEVKDVTISGESVTCLVISFNTDAGKQDINIPLTEIFDPSNYYTKSEVDTALGNKADLSAATVTSSETGTVTTAKTDQFISVSFNYDDGVYYLSGGSFHWSSNATSFNITISDGTDSINLGKNDAGDTSNYTFTTSTNNFVIQTKGSYKVTDLSMFFEEDAQQVSYTYNYSRNAEVAVSTVIEDNIIPRLNSMDIEIAGKADTTAVTQSISEAVSGKADSSSVYLKSETSGATEISTALAEKQATLVNQENIKSINGNSLLGSGDLTVDTGLHAEVSGTTLIFS